MIKHYYLKDLAPKGRAAMVKYNKWYYIDRQKLIICGCVIPIGKQINISLSFVFRPSTFNPNFTAVRTCKECTTCHGKGTAPISPSDIY